MKAPQICINRTNMVSIEIQECRRLIVILGNVFARRVIAWLINVQADVLITQMPRSADNLRHSSTLNFWLV